MLKTFGSVVLAMLPLAAVAELPSDTIRIVSEEQVADPRQPQVAIGNDGTVAVAFAAQQTVYCAVSADAAISFGPVVRVAELPGLALGRRRGPRIAVAGDVLVVSAISHESGNLFAWQSADGGATWSHPVQVNDSARDAREGLHAMAAAADGSVFCAWLDLRSGSTEIFGSHSTDGGQTWSSNQRVYRSPSGTVCECCHPAVDYDASGNLTVMWRNSLDGSRDLYLSQSRDHGKTFTAARKLGTGSWQLQACPMDGGYLAATNDGRLTTAWQRDGRVYRTDSDSPGEQLVGAGIQPWVAATNEGTFIVWLTKRHGRLLLMGGGLSGHQLIAESAADPVIAAAVTERGPVVVVWESQQDTGTAVLARVVRR